jgi:hypothetical protein
VRDLSRTLKQRLPMKTVYEISAEIQLSIEAAENDEVLWSETLAEAGEETESRTWWEVATGSRRTLLYAGGAVLALILLSTWLRSMRRPR